MVPANVGSPVIAYSFQAEWEDHNISSSVHESSFLTFLYHPFPRSFHRCLSPLFHNMPMQHSCPWLMIFQRGGFSKFEGFCCYADPWILLGLSCLATSVSPFSMDSLTLFRNLSWSWIFLYHAKLESLDVVLGKTISKAARCFGVAQGPVPNGVRMLMSMHQVKHGW